jgi:hypothetical protein
MEKTEEKKDNNKKEKGKGGDNNIEEEKSSSWCFDFENFLLIIFINVHGPPFSNISGNINFFQFFCYFLEEIHVLLSRLRL